MTKQFFDMAYIKQMSAGDDATKKQLLEILIDQLKNDLPRATSLLANEEWEELARFCHHFKSTIAFTGNNQLNKANLQLWEIAKKQGKTTAKPEAILKSMQSLAKRIEKEASALLNKL